MRGELRGVLSGRKDGTGAGRASTFSSHGLLLGSWLGVPLSASHHQHCGGLRGALSGEEGGLGPQAMCPLFPHGLLPVMQLGAPPRASHHQCYEGLQGGPLAGMKFQSQAMLWSRHISASSPNTHTVNNSAILMLEPYWLPAFPT